MDGQGKVLLDWEVPASFSSILLSSPELNPGETCYVKIGDLEDEVTVNAADTAKSPASQG